jgi:integrative and conjugative element protein (TIGR02256 family)
MSISVMEVLNEFRQLNSKDHEAGGVLLGRYILGTDDIVIDLVTTPQIGDSRSRTRFFRASWRHQKLITKAWRESNETVTYLGEWHTHPEPVPHPSRTDRMSWMKKVTFDRFTDAIFFVIVGTSEMCVWEGRRRSFNVVQLAEARNVNHEHSR